MTYGPKKKGCKSSLKNSQIFLYFADSLMVNLVICLPATLTHTRDLYPHPHPHPRPLPASQVAWNFLESFQLSDFNEM